MIGFLGDSKFSNMIWKVVMFLAVVSFCLSGAIFYGARSSGERYIAKVNKQTITESQFKFNVEEQLNKLRQIYGENFEQLREDPKFLAEFKKSVLNNLIEKALIKEYSEKLEITIGDPDIKAAIINDPTFQRDGKFDNQLYLDILKQNNLTPDQFAENIRRNLSETALANSLLETEFTTPKALKDKMDFLAREYEVRLAKININQLIAEQKITDEQINSYYQQNQGAFIAPEQVKIKYIELKKEQFSKDPSKVNDLAIAQYYQDNKEQYTEPKKQRFSIITIGSKTLADETYNQLKEGTDFAELAKTKSEDKITASKGGDIGWQEESSLQQIKDNISGLIKVGDYTKPFEMDGKYHIFKLTDQKEAQIKFLNEVKDSIKDKLVEENQIKQYYDLANKLADESKQQKSIEELAKENNLEVKTTDDFSKDNTPEPLNNINFIKTIFNDNIEQQNNAAPNLVQLADEHSILYQVVDYKKQYVKSLDTVKDNIVALLKKQQAETVALEKADKIVEKIQQHGESSVADEKVSFGEVEQYKLLTDKPTNITNKIFQMQSPKQVSSYDYVIADDNLVIIALDKIKSYNLDNNEQTRLEKIIDVSNLENLKDIFSKSLQSNIHVEINSELLDLQLKDDLEDN